MDPNHLESVRILIVNDHEWSARSLETLLSPDGYEVVRVFTAGQARAAIADHSPDAIVLDTQLPDLDGPDFCAELRANGLVESNVPILITTAAPAGRVERTRALRAGAWDFFPLPVDTELFLLKLTNLLAGRCASRASALLDKQTGCCNEAGLFVRGGALAEAAEAQGLRVSCVRVGVPTISSALGGLIRAIGRRSDVYAVVGGSELAVLAPVVDDRGARAMAERLAKGLFGIDDPEGQREMPIGYATSEPDPRGIRSLFHQAERALAQARTSGQSGPVGHHELLVT